MSPPDNSTTHSSSELEPMGKTPSYSWYESWHFDSSEGGKGACPASSPWFPRIVLLWPGTIGRTSRRRIRNGRSLILCFLFLFSCYLACINACMHLCARKTKVSWCEWCCFFVLRVTSTCMVPSLFCFWESPDGQRLLPSDFSSASYTILTIFCWTPWWPMDKMDT